MTYTETKHTPFYLLSSVISVDGILTLFSGASTGLKKLRIHKPYGNFLLVSETIIINLKLTYVKRYTIYHKPFEKKFSLISKIYGISEMTIMGENSDS